MDSSGVTNVDVDREGTLVPRQKYIPVLDGIRAFAVLIVIAFHFLQRFTPSSHSDLVGKVAVWGQTGVDLFFVLSGFLITGILLDSKGTEHFLRNFYIRRILRIFPLYYAALFAVYFLGPLLHLNAWTPWMKSIWYWVYLQNIETTFAPGVASGPNHFWSLAVEEHYYLVWPFVVMVLTPSKLFRAIGVAIAVSLLTRVVIPYAAFPFTLARLDGLAIGSALAIFARSPSGGLERFVAWARGLVCIVGPLLVVSQLLVGGQGLFVIQVLKGTLIAVIYACFIVLAIENKLGRVLHLLLASKVMRTIGKFSYGMYILHPFILSALRKAGIPFTGGAFIRALGMSVTYLATFVAAWISWNLLESRFLRLKRFFEYSSVKSDLPKTVP